jgi:hypothetical protein
MSVGEMENILNNGRTEKRKISFNIGVGKMENILNYMLGRMENIRFSTIGVGNGKYP